MDSIVGIYEAVLKGKLHQGYHRLNFFCVFLERVVGKLSKPLSGHNSEIYAASAAGLIFTRHSSAPSLVLVGLSPVVAAFAHVC